MYRKYGKRFLDILLASCALAVLSPLLLVLAALVRAQLGSPVIFRQQRPGYRGKIFWLYKFRSMTDERDGEGRLLPDEKRLPRFGKILRATSLDELPELWNVLRGDMSLVGPRPLLVKYLPLYNDFQRRRHDVRPGITGLAQVSGRNAIGWEQRFALDVKYVETLSFRLDCEILLRTVTAVFRREGIHSRDSATMEEFRGTKEACGADEPLGTRAARGADESEEIK